MLPQVLYKITKEFTGKPNLTFIMTSTAQPTEKNTTTPASQSKQPVLIVANDDGSVIITNAAGKVKKRKGQPEEAFQQQLEEFRTNGPQLQTQNWLINAYETELSVYNGLKLQKDFSCVNLTEHLSLFNVESKVNKHQLIHTAENQYYHRNYDKAIEICDLILELFDKFNVVKKNKKESQEIIQIKEYSIKKKNY